MDSEPHLRKQREDFGFYAEGGRWGPEGVPRGKSGCSDQRTKGGFWGEEIPDALVKAQSVSAHVGETVPEQGMTWNQNRHSRNQQLCRLEFLEEVTMSESEPPRGGHRRETTCGPRCAPGLSPDTLDVQECLRGGRSLQAQPLSRNLANIKQPLRGTVISFQV